MFNHLFETLVVLLFRFYSQRTLEQYKSSHSFGGCELKLIYSYSFRINKYLNTSQIFNIYISSDTRAARCTLGRSARSSLVTVSLTFTATAAADWVQLLPVVSKHSVHLRIHPVIVTLVSKHSLHS